MGAESVNRFTAADYGDALPTHLEVLEQEAEDRRQRRIGRLRPASGLPAGKTWETFEHDRVPLSLRQQLRQSWRQRAGLRTARHWKDPRTVRRGPPSGGGRTLGALRPGITAGAEPAPAEAGDLPATKRDLALPRQLRQLDNYDFLLLDDLGYLPQVAEESEVLFTLIAERYERRSLGITSTSTSSPTQWQPQRLSTGWSTTRSSWNSTSPATARQWLSSVVRNRR